MDSIGSVGFWLLTCWNFSKFPFLGDLLSQHKISVCKAKTEDELFAQAENKRPPSLILLNADHDCVRVIGICRSLKRNKNTENIPICVLLPEGSSVNRLEFFKSGVVEILEPSWGAQELSLRLGRYLRVDHSRCSFASNANVHPPLSQGKELVWAAQQILEFASNQLPTQHDLARQLGTTEHRLNVAFRNELGLSVFEYLRIKTLSEALDLLADNQRSVLEIAELCGYSGTASFTTAFRKLMGMPPTAYRKLALQQS